MLFGVFIYEGVEPVDLATFGVLSLARRIRPEIRICTIAPDKGEIRLSNGLVVHADFGIEDAPELDALIVTGGPGWARQARDVPTLRFLKKRHETCTVVSVCTGAMILAAAGLLDGRAATTKKEVVPPEYPPIRQLHEGYAAIDVVSATVVDAGPVITGGGVTLCIDTTLYLLEKIFGAGMASETARIMEYTVAREANARASPPHIHETQNDR